MNRRRVPGLRVVKAVGPASWIGRPGCQNCDPRARHTGLIATQPPARDSLAAHICTCRAVFLVRDVAILRLLAPSPSLSAKGDGPVLGFSGPVAPELNESWELKK